MFADRHKEMTDGELAAHFNAILGKIPLRNAKVTRSFVCDPITGATTATDETANVVLDHSTGKILKQANG